jgi:4-hydroxybenzoate polyprenyltransferase
MSWAKLVARYLAQRARLRVFVPLSLLLAGSSRVFHADGFGAVGDFLVSAGVALALALAFRVWDDMEDRDRDVVEHPDRVMATVPSSTPFVVLSGALTVVAAVGLVATRPITFPLEAITATSIVLHIWYRARGDYRNNFVVLLKYPAIAAAVAPGGAPPSPLAIALVYLVVCAFEVFDDPALRASITSRFGQRQP